MHEERSGSEQQPPEYPSAWSASQDSADDHVASPDADAGQALPAEAGGAPGEHVTQAQDLPEGHEPGAGPPAGGGYEQPTMIYAPPGSYVPPGTDEPAADGAGHGAAGAERGAGGYGPGYAGDAGYAGGAGYSEAGYGGAGYGSNPGYGSAGYGSGTGYGSNAGYGGGAGFGGGPGYPGGYGPGEYGGPGGPYPPGGYGMPGDIIGYGQDRPPRRGSRVLTYVVVAALAAGVGAGTVLALNHNGSPSSAPSISLPGAGAVPGPGSRSGAGGSTNASSSVQRAVAKKVSPGIVDVISQPAYQSGTLEGTGMILSSNGLVLTNNHVIEGTNSWTVKLASNTRTTYAVTVLGEDPVHDVALLKLNGATNLTPVPLGNSNSVKAGDAVVALGNANGQDGPPAVVSGHITGLNESIKASDQGAGTTENLHDMLATNAPIISGDSGGALANTAGQVIGMNTAANSTPNAAGGQGPSMGFAIPINRALEIARNIAAGHATADIQIGLPAFLGVTVARGAGNGSSQTTSPQGQWQELRNAANAQNGFGFGGNPGSSGTGGHCLTSNDTLSVPAHIANVSSGALVSGVLCSVAANGPGGQAASPAAAAGMTAGSVITSINGQAVRSPAALTQVLTGYHPDNTISVTWVAPKGQQHTASIKLAAGPAK